MITVDSKKDFLRIHPVRSLTLTILTSAWYIFALSIILKGAKTLILGNYPVLPTVLLALVFFAFTSVYTYILVWNYTRYDIVEFNDNNVKLKKNQVLKSTCMVFENHLIKIEIKQRPGVLGKFNNKFLGVGNWMVVIKSYDRSISIGVGMTRQEAELTSNFIAKHSKANVQKV